jgi:ferredoxin--NADP+ reductase
MTSAMPVSIAIIGAGPGGFYAAESLVKSGLDCAIDLIEGLPVPYGLIRFGVAPDHEHTKRVTRAYERTAKGEAVRYNGNVEIGRDLSLAGLRAIYDVVVLAIGAPLDRGLEIPGADKKGIHGSAAFVGWYNGHPDFCELDPDLKVENAAIIGNGNVALDLARVLVKTPAEMAKTDLPSELAQAIHGSPIKDVHIFGRRGPNEAKWTNVELREMSKLEDARPVVDLAQIPDGVEGKLSARDRRLKEKNLATIQAFPEVAPAGRTKSVHFEFFASPVEVLGGERIEALVLERTKLENGRAVSTGETFQVPCGLLISAIGYRTKVMEGLVYDETRGIVQNNDGRVAAGLYAVGWAKRGPTGVIGSNKPDGNLLARQVAADFSEGGKPGRAALEDLLTERRVRWVRFADWKAIEAAEIAAAPPGAPRRKLIRVNDMLAVLDRLPHQN